MEFNMEDNKVFITNDKGEKIEGEILFTFEANGDNFVLYSIGEEAFAGKVDLDNNITPVEEDE